MVLAIIAILSALLPPALSKAREPARRAECASNLHQFALGQIMIARDEHDRYASALRNSGDYHASYISSELHNRFRVHLGKEVSPLPEHASRGVSVAPVFAEGRALERFGHWVGHRLLQPGRGTAGGSGPAERARARSERAGGCVGLAPDHQRGGDLPIAADINEDMTHATGNTMSNAPHTRGGHVWAQTRSRPDISPPALGAQGGNVGFADGSARWTPIRQMKPTASGAWAR